jgi:hypothetical protein
MDQEGLAAGHLDISLVFLRLSANAKTIPKFKVATAYF